MKFHRELSLSLAVVMALTFTARGDDPVVIITSTQPAKDDVDKIIKCPKDQDAFLTCAVTNKPVDSDVKWVMTTEVGNILNPISTDLSSEDPFKHALEKPSPTAWRLKIQNVQVTDEGTYICRVQTGPQTYVDDVARLRVTEVPRIADLETSSDTTVKEGDDVRLTCNATGRPFPSVSWSRMAGDLLPTGGEELQEYVLRIPSARAEHAGIYKCSAKSFAGTDVRKIYLQVKFAPRVTADSLRISQKVGYYKDLVCNVQAYPVPESDQVAWSHSVNPVVSGGRFEIRNVQGAYNRITSYLTIKGVQPQDFGNYRCSATNEQGDGETAIELIASNEASPDRTGVIRSSSSTLAISLTTIIMLISTCLLHGMHW